MSKDNFIKKLENFNYSRPTKVEAFQVSGKKFKKYINEFWTSKQRQGNSLHEIAYRACFKSELPSFFIKNLSKEGDFVYDPFAGRGTTPIEAALLGRNIISNDINPISKILCKPRLSPPNLDELEKRLYSIPLLKNIDDIDLSAFYHKDTEMEIRSIKKYLYERKKSRKEDAIDEWIRMITTNRLTGHSSGFFSVYTLPPNQAVSIKSQEKINLKRTQKPEYRDTRKIILKKTKSLIRDLNTDLISNLSKAKISAKFLEKDCRKTTEIKNNTIQLTVTSPPFLDVIQYADDNWLRCWFNSIDSKQIEKRITMSKNVDEWNKVMGDTLKELYRITKKGGYIAFEVGEVRDGKVRLDELIAPIGINAGFEFMGIMINEQSFTKTSNIWGISNNEKGTNSNRIVLLRK